MALVHRSDLLPHVDALVRLIRCADQPELLLAEIVDLLMIRNPVNAEAVVVRSQAHIEAIERYGAALQAHADTGAASRSSDMRKGVQGAVRATRDELTATLRLQERLAELDRLRGPAGR